MSSLKKLNLKSLHSFFFAPKQAFTLVELIVVISVLGVLATIAFTQVSNVTLSARNSTRMTNIQSISSSLNIYKATNGTYPIPDNKTDILYSGTTIGYQGYIKDTAARLLKLSPSSSQDPLNTSTYFSYATNQSRTHAQLLGFLEANTTSFKLLPATFASDELSNKTPYSKGEELGMLYASGTTTPLAGVSIELNTLTNSYTAYYNSNDLLTGTGNLLQNLVISYSHGSGFGSPSTDSCPTGFIPVPGNKDFNQPGFCVMKYEAKVAGGVVGPSAQGILYKSHDYLTGETVVSTASDIPAATITQVQAISVCRSMGLHLITNNEWMTIARNIEQVPSNWSTNQVGSGFLYSGHNDTGPYHAITATTNDLDGYYNTNDEANFPGDGIYSNYSSNMEQAYKGQRRTLFLSNGSTIWDFAGNLSEHVNKQNSLDGYGNATGQSSFASASPQGCFWNLGDVSCFEIGAATDGVVSKINNFSIGNYTSINGVGMGYLYGGLSNNIFRRGGDWKGGPFVGIFNIMLHWTNDNLRYDTGFRCAK